MKLSFKIQTIVLAIFTSIIFVSSGYTQVVANFTVNKVSGCVPLFGVVFTDLSSGNITSREWFFGDGNSASSSSGNPLATASNLYLQSGCFDVTLIVSDGVYTDTLVLVDLVCAYASPTPQFTINRDSGCLPLNVCYTNTSTPGDAPITSVKWFFGDGNDTSISPICHDYIAFGDYTPCIIVTDSNGCGGALSGVLCKTDLIHVEEKPTASFTSSNISAACTSPYTVNFVNQSTGNNIISYKWYFGDGSTSNALNPSHLYTSVGAFDVSLVVETSAGCKDSISKSQFSQIGFIQAGIGFSKDTACVGEDFSFFSTSLGAISFDWTWSCCGNYIVDSSSVIFLNANLGYNVVSLIVTGNGGCKDTLVDSIYVQEVVADFGVVKLASCQFPVTIQYNDQSTTSSGSSIVNWDWGFENGNTSSGQNTIQNYPSSGTFMDTLIVQSSAGCSAAVVKPTLVTGQFITPLINSNKKDGCAPLIVIFSDSIIPSYAAGSINSWLWVFGDQNSGSNDTSYLQSPIHVYNNPGLYVVTLQMTDTLGCIYNVIDSIKAGIQVQGDFIALNDTSCAFTAIPFQDTSPDSLIIETYQWLFSDGSTSLDRNPVHNYSDTGWVGAILIVENQGCRDTVVKDSIAYILPPYISGAVTQSCDSPYFYEFEVTDTLGVDLYHWDYGDGSPIDTNLQYTTHTYSNSGNYFAKLSAFNDSSQCIYVATYNIKVRDLIVDFYIDPYACVKQPTVLDASVGQDADYWAWGFDGINYPFTGQQITYSFDSVGTYNVYLLASDANACIDTIVKQVVINGPKPYFSIDSAQGCVIHNVNFTDLSIDDTTIVAWKWFFGDGDSSLVQNPFHSYTSPGLFDVELIIQDTLGCIDTIIMTDFVNPLQPIPSISVVDSFVCLGDSVCFLNNSTIIGNTGLSYVWNFGDANISTSVNPCHNYSDTGWYDITLIATDLLLGCDSILTFYNAVQVQGYPNAGFFSPNSIRACFPVSVDFQDTSKGDFISNWQWDFGDNTPGSSIQNPAYLYNFFGDYDVSLIVTTSAGCSDTVIYNDFAQISPLYADFLTTNDTLCKWEDISFYVDSSINVSSIDWYFGDGGFILDSPNDSIVHQFSDTGKFTISLVYRSDTSCQKLYSQEVVVHSIYADFTLSDTLLCSDTNTIIFNNTSPYADQLYWSLGDGTDTSALNTFAHTYYGVGLFPVNLTVVNDSTGCMDSVQKSIRVGIYDLTLIEDTTICLGDSLNIFANSSQPYTYDWRIDSGYISNISISNPEAYSDKDFDLYLTIIDTNNCQTTKNISVDVIQNGVLNVISPENGDTAVVSGEPVYISLNGIPYQGALSYDWGLIDGLDCYTCPEVMAIIYEPTIYEVNVSDEFGCWSEKRQITIKLAGESSIDVPTAFTPDADGFNDVVYVRGWGIDQLIEFKIYNRWGELVYNNPGDIKDGWDGTYKGKVQNPDSYSVIVTAIGYDGRQLYYKGSLNILK